MKSLLRPLLWQTKRVVCGLVAVVAVVCSHALALAGGVKIEFLPPPMEGTISLGIYDQSGKLVRVLHQEAELEEFKVALNGLVTEWDGNDDAGAPCPAGKYRARGYRVGDVKIEGIEILGNDWVTEEDSPRINRILRIAPHLRKGIAIQATSPDSADPKPYLITPQAPDKEGAVVWALTKPTGLEGVECGQRPFITWTLLPTGEIQAADISGKTIHTLPAPEKPEGAAGGVWVPKQIVSENECVYILEEAPAGQRLRALKLEEASSNTQEIPPAAAAAPGERAESVEPTKGRPEMVETVLFEKEILFSQTAEQAAPLLRFPDGSPFVASPNLRVSLVPNPLIKKSAPFVSIQIALNEKGASLTTADGLPLVQVSETPHLKWAVLGRPEKEKTVVTIFESDGAAIEEFRTAHLSQMMAFDAGSFALKATPTPATAITPEATPAPAASPAESPAPATDPVPPATAPEATPAAAEATPAAPTAQ